MKLFSQLFFFSLSFNRDKIHFNAICKLKSTFKWNAPTLTLLVTTIHSPYVILQKNYKCAVKFQQTTNLYDKMHLWDYYCLNEQCNFKNLCLYYIHLLFLFLFITHTQKTSELNTFHRRWILKTKLFIHVQKWKIKIYCLNERSA